MKKYTEWFLGLICAMVCLEVTAFAENLHRVGAGIHYWASIEDILIDEADDDGLAVILSYQHQFLKLFTLEADLEFMGKGYAGAPEAIVAPQCYALVGRGLYAGTGVGISYTGGEWNETPFWAVRAGFDLELLPSIFLDLNVNYRTERWELHLLKDELTLKTITTGAVLRYEF
ncbi:hypothetical protein CSB45_06915 [candidate division KSB3 bacterium]|uniref:Outer membrane protein beta-barrel domain-containing protein n=1 Tax=candidate division KSB3 bacterium TaxID=2044937 RepID=A0A2G6E639_9BACT|nr:MAG: hypothetical protein CSB45_06915 [candidate division KSB3 bacterium]PIE30034.1 MAG: hypothetical protein CSA57_05680 [candidate division KSB3 bacterium]